MRDGQLLILKGHEVAALLEGREPELIELVRRAYAVHAAGRSSLPHSVFLRFPDDESARIIALPTYLGGEFAAAGIKWVSSFPANLPKGLDRASAVVILNSTETGRPEAIMEGSIISAKRTAASAALAARHLHGERADAVGLLGCGLINFEVLKFLTAVYGSFETLTVSDLSRERAEQFRRKCAALYPEQKVVVEPDVRALLRGSSLLSLATTAVKPHIFDLSCCAPGTTVLHVSLRDLSPEVILSSDNVVDDVDHVCRAQTSVHLAEQLAGHRGFIRCTLADVFTDGAPAKADAAAHTVFSPFGLGVLDIAVGRFLSQLANDEKVGTVIDSFLPAPWVERSA